MIPFGLVFLFMMVAFFVALLLYMVYYVITSKSPNGNCTEDFFREQLRLEAEAILKEFNKFTGFGK